MTAAKINEVVIAGVIALIADHFAINEVFTEEKIKEHVRENNSVAEVFKKSDILLWITSFDPGELFSFEALSKWAKDNGFVELEGGAR